MLSLILGAVYAVYMCAYVICSIGVSPICIYVCTYIRACVCIEQTRDSAVHVRMAVGCVHINAIFPPCSAMNQ